MTTKTLTILALALFAGATRSAAQRNNELSLGAQAVGGSLSYARSMSPGRFIGVQAGIGGHLVEYMVLAGRHFSEDNGLHYEPRDDATNPLLFEVLSFSAFYRVEPSKRWQIDTGVRGSAFLHYDSSDDDSGGGTFAGTYTAVLFGWKNVKLGPEVLVGVFSDGQRHEFGVHFAPFMGRVTIGW